jgi:uncharacterized membrane protein
MTAAAGQPSGGTPGRGLRIALALSLALNLVIAGAVGGALWRGGPAAVGRDLGFGPLAGAFDKDDRAALRQALAARAGGLREGRRALAADMRAMAAAVRADPYDPAAVAAAFDRAAARAAERMALGRDVMLAHLAAMDPAARKAFADRLERVAGRRGGPP